KISGRAARAVERLYVRQELDQVAADEPGRQAEMAAKLDEEPAGVATGAACFSERLFRSLDTGFETDEILDLALEALIEPDEEINRARLLNRPRGIAGSRQVWTDRNGRRNLLQRRGNGAAVSF